MLGSCYGDLCQYHPPGRAQTELSSTPVFLFAWGLPLLAASCYLSLSFLSFSPASWEAGDPLGGAGEWEPW